MRKISTVGMDQNKEHKLMGNLIGVFGNENIRGCHIQYFEHKVVEQGENIRDCISSAPNYYAWLWLMAEHIFWGMRMFCFTKSEPQEKDEDLDNDYKKLVERFWDECRSLNLCSEDELQSLYEVSDKVLEIRHAMVHKGFPNVLPAPFNKKRPKPVSPQSGKEEHFTIGRTREIIAWYLNPQNFHRIKKEFEFLIGVMSKGPGLTVDFGSLFSVSCGGADKPTTQSQ